MSDKKTIKTKMKDRELLARVFKEYLKAENIETASGKEPLIARMYHANENEAAIMVARKGTLKGPYPANYGDMGAKVSKEGTLDIIYDNTDIHDPKKFLSDIMVEYNKLNIEKTCKAYGALGKPEIVGTSASGKIKVRVKIDADRIPHRHKREVIL